MYSICTNVRTSNLLFSTFTSSSSSFMLDLTACGLTGTSTSFSTSMAVARLSGSSYSAKPNRHALFSASMALIHRLKLPAHCRIRSMPSSPPEPSVIPPTNMVRVISSFVGGINCIMLSRTACRCASMPCPAPKPGLAGLESASRRPGSPDSMAGFDGPVVPRRMTGALKLILGILAGG